MNDINNSSNSSTGGSTKKEPVVQRETKLIVSSFNRALSPEGEYLFVIKNILEKIEAKNIRVLNIEKKLFLQSCKKFQELYGAEKLEEEFGKEELQALIDQIQNELKEKYEISEKAYHEAIEKWKLDNQTQ